MARAPESPFSNGPREIDPKRPTLNLDSDDVKPRRPHISRPGNDRRAYRPRWDRHNEFCFRHACQDDSPIGPEDEKYSSLKIDTYLHVITSHRVLEQAISNVLVRELPMIKQSQDPKATLRGQMVVERVPNTSLIRIALESAGPEEAATIVNTVVESFSEQASTFQTPHHRH